jgi:glutathione S-transferase
MFFVARALQLSIGDRTYSSWSLRPYLVLAHAGLPFDVEVIWLDRPGSAAALAAASPSARVPVLRDGELVIHDSLAICEYVAELAPHADLWPVDRAARARARALAAEMHSGFAALRRDMPMDLRTPHPGQGHTPAALADAAQVMARWRAALAARAGDQVAAGPFLFGAFGIVDAMFAPVVTRLATYGVPLDEPCAAYVAAIEALPAMRAWRVDAAREPAREPA